MHDLLGEDTVGENPPRQREARARRAGSTTRPAPAGRRSPTAPRERRRRTAAAALRVRHRGRPAGPASHIRCSERIAGTDEIGSRSWPARTRLLRPTGCASSSRSTRRAGRSRPIGTRAWPAAGFVAPHWPEPWGLDAGPTEQLELDEVMRELHVPRPLNPIGIGWAGPDAARRGHRGATTALAARAPRRLRALVPALQRAGRGQRPLVARRPARRATATSTS